MVHLDGCVEVEAACYGLPPGWIGRPVKVQWDQLHVRVLHPSTTNFFANTCARVSRFHQSQNQGATRMNLIELSRSLWQLRIGGIAAVLEMRAQ